MDCMNEKVQVQEVVVEVEEEEMDPGKNSLQLDSSQEVEEEGEMRRLVTKTVHLLERTAGRKVAQEPW